MATIAGKVLNIKNGNFEVKDEKGNIKALNEGDTIYKNDLIYGVGANKASAKIEVELSNSDVVVLNHGQKQLIDATLIETAGGEDELFFSVGDIDLVMEAYRDIIDVVSGLGGHTWDTTDEETAEGEEEAEDTESGSAGFLARSGDSIETTSTIINKRVPTQENAQTPPSTRISFLELKSLMKVEETKLN